MMLYKTWQDLLKMINSIDGELYIAGAGNLGRIYGEFLNRSKITWYGFLDKQLFTETICGKNVYEYESICGHDDCYVLISSTTYSEEIKDRLIELGAKEDRIFYPNKYDTQPVLELMDEMYHINELTSKLIRFHNIHKGKRCFIIGNGPSLRITDLELLKNEITFASNSIYALYDYTSWRPTYYSVSDPTAIKSLQSGQVIKKICESKVVFTGLISWIYLQNIGNKVDNIFYYRNINGLDEEKKEAHFSEDISKEIFTSGTITYVLLQLAIYMGIETIYLLGVDFTFSNEKRANGEIIKRSIINHNELIEQEEEKTYSFFEKMFGAKYIAYTDFQLWGYRAAKEYASRKGIEIYNATRGGKLDIYDRVNFDQLFNEKVF